MTVNKGQGMSDQLFMDRMTEWMRSYIDHCLATDPVDRQGMANGFMWAFMTAVYAERKGCATTAKMYAEGLREELAGASAAVREVTILTAEEIARAILARHDLPQN